MREGCVRSADIDTVLYEYVQTNSVMTLIVVLIVLLVILLSKHFLIFVRPRPDFGAGVTYPWPFLGHIYVYSKFLMNRSFTWHSNDLKT